MDKKYHREGRTAEGTIKMTDQSKLVLLRAYPKPIRKKRDFKRPAVMESVPLEDSEQYTLIEWLKLHRILHTANVPDRRNCHRLGYSKGIPDILIFDRPEIVENGLVYVGTCIELKRRVGGALSVEQKQWLLDLHDKGWASYCVKGADAAIKLLEFLYLGKGLNPCPSKEILQAKDLEATAPPSTKTPG